MGRNFFLSTTYLVNYINSAVLTNSNDSSDTIDVTQYITFSDNSSYGSLLYYDDVLQPYYDSKEYVMTIEVEYSNIVPVFTFGTRLELEPGISPHNSYSVSLGLDNIVNRELSFAQGKGNSIDNRYSVALGVGNTIGHWVGGNGMDYSFAIGKGNNVHGSENVAIGINNTISSDNGFAFGMQNQVTANSFAIGRRNNADRDSLGDISRCSVAIGDGATSTGDGSVALNNATAKGMNSIACNSSYASGINSCTLGKYNVVDSSNQYAVIVGNGSSSSRSNALTLDWSGNLNVAGNVKLSNSIKCKTYKWTISSIGANEYKSTEVNPPAESGYTPIGIIGTRIDGTGNSSATWVKYHIRPSDNKMVIGIRNDSATARTDWTATVYILYVKS